MIRKGQGGFSGGATDLSQQIAELIGEGLYFGPLDLSQPWRVDLEHVYRRVENSCLIWIALSATSPL
uniref:Ferritin family protein 3 n=1 Tax=Rhizophora mucronata TaxID=61149 RepID=A0A2P2KC57_RHIMU